MNWRGGLNEHCSYIFDELREDKKKRVYPCKICGREFKDSTRQWTHVNANLWRISYDKTLDLDHLKCKYCKKEFITEKKLSGVVSALLKFKNHFTGTGGCWNTAHNKYWYGPPKKGKGKWTTRPSYRAEIKRKMRTDKSKWNLRHGRNVTSTFVRELQWGFDEEASNTLAIYGMPGHGKSVSSLIVARKLQEMGQEKWGYWPKVIFTRSIAETTDAFREARAGDVIIQDESILLVSYGAVTAGKLISNLMMTMRQAQIHMVFVTPWKLSDEIQTRQAILECIAMNKTERINQLVMFDAEQFSMGYVYVKILPDNDEVMVRYRAFKKSMVDSFREKGGAITGAMSVERFQSMIQEFRKYLEEEGIDATKKSTDELMRIGSRAGVLAAQMGDARDVANHVKELAILMAKTSMTQEELKRLHAEKSKHIDKVIIHVYEFLKSTGMTTKRQMAVELLKVDWASLRGNLLLDDEFKELKKRASEVAIERILAELEELEEEELDDEVGTTEPLTGRSGVLHHWNEYRTIEGEEALEVLRVIADEAPNVRTRKKRKSGRWAFAKPKRLRELIIASWCWYLYNGHDPPMKQQPARDETAEKFPKEKVCNRPMMFRDAIRTGKSKRSEGWVPRWVRTGLGYAGELAAKRLWFLNHIVNPDEHGPDLIDKTGQEAPVEVKVRMEYRDPNTENGERELFKRVGTYLNRILEERGALHLVQVNWRRGVCVVHFYALEYPEQ